MSTLAWIVTSGVAMGAIALIGSATLLLRPEQLQRLLLPMVAFAAGSLGGALLHMLPAAIEQMGMRLTVFLWLLAGFTVFFAVEQLLHWHHSHRVILGVERQPLTYLVLVRRRTPQFPRRPRGGCCFHCRRSRGNRRSASTFLVGGLLAYAGSTRVDLSFFLPFAAGNFLYIAASDLVPEVKHNHGLQDNAVHLVALMSGIALLYVLRVALGE